jgi:hypothetical protein
MGSRIQKNGYSPVFPGWFISPRRAFSLKERCFLRPADKIGLSEHAPRFASLFHYPNETFIGSESGKFLYVPVDRS